MLVLDLCRDRISQVLPTTVPDSVACNFERQYEGATLYVLTKLVVAFQQL